jgi:hypothetical protein
MYVTDQLYAIGNSIHKTTVWTWHMPQLSQVKCTYKLQGNSDDILVNTG